MPEFGRLPKTDLRGASGWDGDNINSKGWPAHPSSDQTPLGSILRVADDLPSAEKEAVYGRYTANRTEVRRKGP